MDSPKPLIPDTATEIGDPLSLIDRIDRCRGSAGYLSGKDWVELPSGLKQRFELQYDPGALLASCKRYGEFMPSESDAIPGIMIDRAAKRIDADCEASGMESGIAMLMFISGFSMKNKETGQRELHLWMHLAVLPASAVVSEMAGSI